MYFLVWRSANLFRIKTNKVLTAYHLQLERVGNMLKPEGIPFLEIANAKKYKNIFSRI